MPTTRDRHPVTETDEVAAVLDAAEIRWPGLSRSRLIVEVLMDWSATGGSGSSQAQARLASIGTMPGISGLYDKDDDWPE